MKPSYARTAPPAGPRPRAVFNWSGGKDSAHALWRILRSSTYDVVALLTTVAKPTRCSTLHDIPESLLQAQAERIGIPLRTVALEPGGDAEAYDAAMAREADFFRARGVTHFVFGDIFLHDVRRYREERLAPLGIEVVEPLWGRPSAEVMMEFLRAGFRTIIVATTADDSDMPLLGKELDAELVAALPTDWDPNGENGEYHTFCYDGPLFREPVPFRLGSPRAHGYDILLDDGSTRHCVYRSVALSDPR